MFETAKNGWFSVTTVTIINITPPSFYTALVSSRIPQAFITCCYVIVTFRYDKSRGAVLFTNIGKNESDLIKKCNLWDMNKEVIKKA